MNKAWRVTEEGLCLTIRLTPKGGRDHVDGLETLSDGRVVLKARVRAVPDRQEANKALLALLAQQLALPQSQINLLSGATSRLKTLLLKGDSRALEQSLIALSLGKDRP